jgi:hypothetical protein
MRKATLFALIAIGLTLVLAGCGGGGDDAATQPPNTSTSSIEGEVEVQGAATDYDLLLDGQPVPGALRADGTYVIEDVPPGQHRVAVIARDGMEGGYATVDVPDGQRARAPRIVPGAGGQIVGIVTVVEDGALRPLAGVEVAAQPAMMILPADEGPDPGDERPSIYPPPVDLPTFETFTDADGSFVIPAVPPGEYSVSVAEPTMEDAWQWVRVRAGRSAVADFRLRPAIEPGVGTVEGIVTGRSDGLLEPLGGARVTVISGSPWEPLGPPAPPVETADRTAEPDEPPMPDPDALAPPRFEAVSTLTDADGSFSLNAPAGHARIEVYLPGWSPVRREIQIRADETVRQDFELELLKGWPPPPPPPGSGEDGGDDPQPPPPPGFEDGDDGDDLTPPPPPSPDDGSGDETALEPPPPPTYQP